MMNNTASINHNSMQMMHSTASMQDNMNQSQPMPMGHGINVEGHGGHSSQTTMGDSMGHEMMMMQMTFYEGVKSTILFKSWTTSTAGEMAGACIAWFVLAFLFELLKVAREHVFKKFNCPVQVNPEELPINPRSYVGALFKPRLAMSHFLQTVLHVVQATLSYFLMLVVMTFNVWLFIAVVAGSTVGFICFGWKKTLETQVSDNLNAGCH